MSSLFEPQAVLRGKYRVVRQLGIGGMARVYEALHLDLDKRVAIKVLREEVLSNASLVDRFLREGRAACRIEGAHVARVLDVDRLEDGTPFLVMEYLEGRDLSLVRRSKTALSQGTAIEYLLQTCAAIREAHEQGIIHRDIKPANLFLTHGRGGEPCVKVLDFGISKVTGDSDGADVSMTKTSVVMGSAEFMSPEQMLSTRDVDVRTDIWALGAVLYEFLTAVPPFAGESMTQVCAMVMSQDVIPPRRLRPEISPALEAVVLRCLEKSRAKRFDSVDELALALRRVRDGGSSEHTELLSAPPSVGEPAPPATPDDELATVFLPETDPKLKAPLGLGAAPSVPPSFGPPSTAPSFGTMPGISPVPSISPSPSNSPSLSTSLSPSSAPPPFLAAAPSWGPISDSASSSPSSSRTSSPSYSAASSPTHGPVSVEAGAQPTATSSKARSVALAIAVGVLGGGALVLGSGLVSLTPEEEKTLASKSPSAEAPSDASPALDRSSPSSLASSEGSSARPEAAVSGAAALSSEPSGLPAEASTVASGAASVDRPVLPVASDRGPAVPSLSVGLAKPSASASSGGLFGKLPAPSAAPTATPPPDQKKPKKPSGID